MNQQRHLPEKYLIKLSCVITLTALLAACGQGGGAPGGPGPGAGMPPAEVDVVTVALGGATLTQDLPGRLQAVRSAQVRARVEGVVEKRLFTEGTDVQAGAALFTIDPRTYKAAVDSARADVALAKLTVDRYKPLLDLKAVSQQEYDQANAKLKQAEAALSKAELDYENASVPAPISGRIGRALVTEGALVGKGDATPLALIEQLDPIYANFTQPGTDMLQLRRAIQAGKLKQTKETKVELVLEDGTPYPLPGKLMFSDLAVDPNTGAIMLRAEIPNPKRDLLPGMFVRVRFPQASMDKAIKVPQRAVITSPQGQSVMVVDAQGKVSPRPIKTGAMSGTDWIVTEGLQPGDQVVVNGLQKAKPGATVKPVQWNPNGAPAAPAATPAAAPAQASAAAPADKPAAQPAKQGS
ncbi:MAG TPA: efflux RND transporter periplasmic adaptor subunit [Rhodocyclaceae bacterium]|nr:efflux RND transporter periplasmic adaptor subunit [Rhodocyclaceae bacterium]